MAVGGRINFEVDDGRFIGQEDKCEICETTKFDGYCSQCEIHFCKICFDKHLISRLCRDHVLAQDPHDNTRQRGTIRFEMCNEHKQMEVKAYCTEHKCCACIECIALCHKLCKWEYIVQASEEFQSSGALARLLEEVQSIEYTLYTYLEEIDKHTETAEALNKDVVSEVESFATSLVEYFAGSKQQVLEDAKARESAHQQRLDKLREDVQSLGSKVEEILTNFRDESLLHKRFILAVETTQKVAVIQNELAAIDCNNVINHYTFQSSNLLKRWMSNTRPIGRLIENSHIENGVEDDDDIELKNEREINQSLHKKLDENQNQLSKLGKDLADMKQNYDGIIKEKQTMQQEISTLKSDNQGVVKEKHNMQQEISTLKSDHQRVIKENENLKQELSKQKNIVHLTCGHKHQTMPGTYIQLIKCGTCGIISDDQPEGTFTSKTSSFSNIEMTFNFPIGTQSKLNRNPGQPYSGTTIRGYLDKDHEGHVILNMMKLAFDRKCLFTVNAQGNIHSGVELMQSEFGFTVTYIQYITRVRKQLEDRGIKESDVTQ